jgi:hypothetical protein
LAEHKTRVSWHIQRIYTTRNQIVHNAEALPYLRTLVENLHSYIDTLFHTISKVGMYASLRLEIPGALRVLSAHEQNYFQALSKENITCKSENYKELIFGRDNPVSPFYNSGN